MKCAGYKGDISKKIKCTYKAKENGYCGYHKRQYSSKEHSSKEHSSKEECCICLSEIEPDKNAQLKCNHHFHINCVLNLRSLTCPLCRVTLSSPLLTKKQIQKIKKREKEDEREREHDNMITAVMIEMFPDGVDEYIKRDDFLAIFVLRFYEIFELEVELVQ